MLFVRHSHLLIIFFLSPACLPDAQAGSVTAGARTAGMANASAALFDLWAITNNQAGTAKLEQPAVALHTENRFMAAEMSMAAIACLIPASTGTFGFALTHFGNHLYHERTAGLSYARQFGDKLSAGIKLNHLYVALGDGYAKKGTLVAEMGLICEVIPDLHIGVHLFNPMRTVIVRYGYLNRAERIPTIIRTGLAYTFSDYLLLCVEAEKEIHHDLTARAGLEYNFRGEMFVRAGISTNPVQNTFGFGLRTGQWQIDIATSYHYILGYSPQAGVVYHFNRRRH